MPNLILQTDSYKVSHWKQYPPQTQTVYSFFESRGGQYPEVTFFGLQYILKAFLAGRAFTTCDIKEAEELLTQHLGPGVFHKEGWQLLKSRYDGFLPIRIRAVREGSTHPAHTTLMTVENTDPDFFWLTNYLETILSQVWYPCTVATQSRSMKRSLLAYLNQNGDPSGIDFKLHDFGYRGVSSDESAAIGAAAHLVNFKGTDTIAGLVMARDYYGEPCAGFSIPAAEHSTITSWGRDNEGEAFQNMLTQYPTGLVAVVSDSYDIYRACTDLWGDKLRNHVLARDGALVVRPDSGHPPYVVMEVLRALGKAFGMSTNSKGFKVLNPKVRVIQGDGIDPLMMSEILDTMDNAGWSADNIAFGSGGGLLQKLNRDTCKFAFKCSAVKVNGEWRDVWKDPVTDPGKRSKRGRFDDEPQLETVFENGMLVREQTFTEVRQLAAEGL